MLLPSTIVEKSFADRHKTVKFAKVFSLESLPLYGILAYLVALNAIDMYSSVTAVWCNYVYCCELN